MKKNRVTKFDDTIQIPNLPNHYVQIGKYDFVLKDKVTHNPVCRHRTLQGCLELFYNHNIKTLLNGPR